MPAGNTGSLSDAPEVRPPRLISSAPAPTRAYTARESENQLEVCIGPSVPPDHDDEYILGVQASSGNP
jgi:hypothetical protein